MSHFAHRTARYVALGQGLLARISFERMLTMLLFAIIVVTSLTISYDPDSWWALRTGQ
jgi:hypothetical protein